jgi:hypothetical protein
VLSLRVFVSLDPTVDTVWLDSRFFAYLARKFSSDQDLLNNILGAYILDKSSKVNI